jgi:hypothetical protein
LLSLPDMQKRRRQATEMIEGLPSGMIDIAIGARALAETAGRRALKKEDRKQQG